ncbi:MAG: hypothetical protein LBU51_00755 [Bacteroidales bacterium]|jgi:hypothetical protein|nr:hypothetical protein [Bacteroidales bacterium]
MKKEEKKLSGEATKEQIIAWKAVHKDIFQIVVEDSVCYLKKPDRLTMKLIASIVVNDPIRSNEVLLENCWLGGDEDIKTEDDKFFGVSQQLVDLIQIKQAELKKL